MVTPSRHAKSWTLRSKMQNQEALRKLILMCLAHMPQRNPLAALARERCNGIPIAGVKEAALLLCHSANMMRKWTVKSTTSVGKTRGLTRGLTTPRASPGTEFTWSPILREIPRLPAVLRHGTPRPVLSITTRSPMHSFKVALCIG